MMGSKLGLRRQGLAAMAAVACLGLAACGSNDSGSSTGSSGGSSTGASSGSSGGGGSIKGKKVVYVACSDQNQWCRAYNHMIVNAMKAEGVNISYLQDPYDPVLQVQHLNQAIAQKPDAIFLLASDARAVVPALRKAKAANIPVVNLVGPTVPESDPYYAARIINNHKELGQNAANLLIQGLQKEGVKGGNIIAITGASVQPEVAVRMGGFKDVLAQHPSYKLVEVQDGAWDQVKTAKIAQQLFAKYRDKGGIVGAYGMADQQAAGIIQSAQQAGLKVGVAKKGLIVVGSNCFKIGMANIAKGTEYGTSTQAAGNTAQFTIPLLKKFLAGEKIPATSLTTEYPVDKANLAKWKTACSVA